MQRYLETALQADLSRKMVVLTGPRQVGKTTLARALMAAWPNAQYLNWSASPARARCNSCATCASPSGAAGSPSSRRRAGSTRWRPDSHA